MSTNLLEDSKIITHEMSEEMKTSYIDYAMSVIVGRALPDVRDGLKPVNRRILYGLSALGITPDKPHKKSARIVGEVMGKYHPHGDSSIYDAMVKMAQVFSTRYPLVDGHGNFGSVDGDGAAASRYTEARMSPFSLQMVRDIGKETVDFADNYDGEEQEPVVLPSRVPNLLINGSNGIAVGMATSIPPHNLGETIDACVKMIDDDECTVDDLIKIIKAPDFPTGAQIIGKEGAREAYRTGTGKVLVRSECEIEEGSRGRTRIVVSSIPYQVNKARLIESMAALVKDKKVEGISNIQDESARGNLRIVIDLKKDVNPNVILNRLYKHTQLQTSYSMIMLALVNGEPKILNLYQILDEYLKHQKEVVTRRTRFDLRKAEERAHILEGYVIALDNIDEVIKVIRSAYNDAKEKLMIRFSLSEAQAQAILDMRLARLQGLEREKIEEELAELRKRIAYFKELLADEKKLMGVIKDELLEIKKKYGDKRRTKLVNGDGELDEEALIDEEDVAITLTHMGYIKRVPENTYKAQRRGGKGILGLTTRDSDFVKDLIITSTHDDLLFFTDMGKVYKMKGYEVPEASRTAKGTPVINFLNLNSGEKVSAVIPVKEFSQDNYLVMITRSGTIKKTPMSEFDSIRKNGLIAINLKDGDELISVKRVAKGEKVIMVSSAGKAILWDESEARAMGRGTMGVRGMNVPADAHVLGMEIAKPGTDLFVITEKGYGKRTKIEEYPEHHRGGQGVYTITMTHKKGLLSVMKIVGPDDEIMIVSEDGVIVRTPVKGISELGRSTQGVKVMNVADKDKVCAVAIASTGKKKAKKAAPADENQMGLLEEESEEGTLAIDDLDDDLGDEGEETEE